MHIQYWGNIALSPGQTELRYICCPFFKRLLCSEVPVDEIVSGLSDGSLIRMIFLFRTLSFEIHLMHKPLDTFVVCFIATIYQLPVDTSYSISSFILIEDLLDLC